MPYGRFSKDDEISLQPYVSITDAFGAVNEEYVKKEGLDEGLFQVKGFKVNGDFNLILRIGVSELHPNNDIHTLRMTYKKFGVSQVHLIMGLLVIGDGKNTYTIIKEDREHVIIM
ncbi:hypothetical protein RZN22_10300 [Bacillaceae bacterium S4-13-58]